MSALSSWTNEELEGVHANVPVDTLGTLARHRHRQPSDPIYLDGRVGRVDGLDFEEVFCYVSDEDSSMEGLALYEYGIEMYWVDRKRDALCGAELECNDYWAVSEGFDEPIDVAVDERAAALYVADHTGIYKMDQVGSDLVLSAADAGLWTST